VVWAAGRGGGRGGGGVGGGGGGGERAQAAWGDSVCGRRGRPVRHRAEHGARVYKCKDLLLYTLQRLFAPASRRHAMWYSPPWRNNKGAISMPAEGNNERKDWTHRRYPQSTQAVT